MTLLHAHLPCEACEVVAIVLMFAPQTIFHMMWVVRSERGIAQGCTTLHASQAVQQVGETSVDSLICCQGRQAYSLVVPRRCPAN